MPLPRTLRRAMLHQALALYRQMFKPSATLAKPYAIVGVPVIAAPSDEEARFLASSTYQRVLGILTGNRTRLMPPIPDFWEQLDGRAQAAIADFLAVGVIGGPGYRAPGPAKAGRRDPGR